jgi:hypothetical protein
MQAHENTLYSNKIINATQHMIKYDDQNTEDNNTINNNNNTK